MKDINRKISLLCSICGNDQFSALDDNISHINEAPDETRIKCSDCGRIITKA